MRTLWRLGGIEDGLRTYRCGRQPTWEAVLALADEGAAGGV